MELSLILSLILLFSLIINVVIFFKFLNLQNLFLKKENQFDYASKELEQIDERFDEIKYENESLKENNLRLTTYEGRFKELQESMNRALIENESIKKDNEYLLREKNNIETQLKLISRERELLQNEKLEWENDKQGILHKLSETLINKGGEVTETKVTKATEILLKQFERVISKVSSFEDDGKRRDDTIDKAITALLHPGGAGLSSETTLENILKSSGLMQKFSKNEDGDFMLQSTLGSSSTNDLKRPDAIIYMPNNNYIIVDSKSSSHFLELEDAVESGNKDKEAELMIKIKDRMNKHLNDLKSKDYQKAQMDYAEIQEKSGIPPTVMTIMFLQTDKMLDIVRKADKDFEMKAYNANIPVITPIGLKNLLNISRYTIAKSKQDKNINNLKEEIRKLMSNITSMFDNANKMGKKMKETIDSYDKFANTFNKNIPLRIKNLNRYGVEAKNQTIKRLETYEVTTNILEGQTEEEAKGIENDSLNDSENNE
jgi:DNA recombination protein RmuC